MPTYYATNKSTDTSTYCVSNITTYCAAFQSSQTWHCDAALITIPKRHGVGKSLSRQ